MTDKRRDALVLGVLVAALLWAGTVGVMAWLTYPMLKAAILDDCSRPAGFIPLLGGAAVWPLAARAQQAERRRRIGVLTQSLEKVDWIEGRNLAIDYRWDDADPERIRNYAII